MARPTKKLTSEQIAQIEALVGYGVIMSEVASYIGLSERTLFNRARVKNSDVARAVARGKAMAHAQITQSLFNAAKGGNVTAMIFYLKTQCGWREKTELEVGFKPIRVFETTVQPDGSLLQQILEEDRAKRTKALADEDASTIDVE